jgi:hypothetical protein
MTNSINERIYCSAIWYHKITPHYPLGLRNPNNITKGVVVLGHRHADIIRNVGNLLGKRTVENGKDSVGEYTQGFLTNKDRFVDRKEGAEIAWRENQILDKGRSNPNYLYSEDIY